MMNRSGKWKRKHGACRIGAPAHGRDAAVNLPPSAHVAPLTLFAPGFFSSWRKVFRSPAHRPEPWPPIRNWPGLPPVRDFTQSFEI